MKNSSLIIMVLLAALFLVSPQRVAAQTPDMMTGKPGSIDCIPVQPPTVDHIAWINMLQAWREKTKVDMRYDDSLYKRPELLWTQSCFVFLSTMAWNRFLYDPVTRQYTVERFLNDVEARHGAIDALMIWNTYPNLGLDNRSEQGILRDMPGGYAGVKAMIADFHRHNVRVFFSINPWDSRTKAEDLPFLEAMARNFKTAGIDGVFGDTMSDCGAKFIAVNEAVGHPMAFHGEQASIDIETNTLGSGRNWKTPAVDPYKWFEPRRMTHFNKWGIQQSFFNGDGIFIEDDIMGGSWRPVSPQQGEAIRRTSIVKRGLSDFLKSADWEPDVAMLHGNVYASRFPLANQTAWMIISTAKIEVDGPQMSVPYIPGVNFFDVWHGRQLTPLINGNTAILSFSIEADGYGAVVALPGTPSAAMQRVLDRMAELSKTKIADFPWCAYWDDQYGSNRILVDIALTQPAVGVPEGMELIPAGLFHFKVHADDTHILNVTAAGGVDVQYPWETAQTLNHDTTMAIKTFYIDTYPVTNKQFKRFITTTHYHPADDHNFLKDWQGGSYPKGWENKPVTWVSIEDARAYATWAGKRLPHEWEWQYAAQGTDGRPYPWGMTPDATAVPTPEHGHELRAPTDVDAFPKGASPFGVMDMMGNVWQWTDEYQNSHIRAAIPRGGSYYQIGAWGSKGGNWYFPTNTILDQHNIYQLLCPGMDRVGTLGFRCVKDL